MNGFDTAAISDATSQTFDLSAVMIKWIEILLLLLLLLLLNKLYLTLTPLPPQHNDVVFVDDGDRCSKLLLLTTTFSLRDEIVMCDIYICVCVCVYV